MKIKITETARKLYGQCCPYSTEKCESLAELDYKIQRCIDLGSVEKYDESLFFIQYYNLEFVVLHKEIIDIKIIREQRYQVGEETKWKHYKRHFKVVV